MTSRRLIRVKVLQLVYAYTKKDKMTWVEMERELLKSISKTTELYFITLLLMTEVRYKAFRKMDSARNKYFATDEELNPNTRFIENPILLTIEKNKRFNNFLRQNPLSWNDTPEVIEKIYNELIHSEAYKEYMNKEEVNFYDHKDIVLYLFTDIIANNESFQQSIEDRNVYWNDDYELVFSILYKTLKSFQEDYDENSNFTFPIYKNEEDENFAKDLLRRTLSFHEENLAYINDFTLNWEVERISEIDKIIMSLAITEFRAFPSIPIKVTLDEYIELAKVYSSHKSSGFINGVLDKILKLLQEKNEVNKLGRGLME